MHLLLIRHAETVDNVTRRYAGSTDSPLTAHGMVQAELLASHLSSNFAITHLFSSDLSRAVNTARTIQPKHCPLTITSSLRERDFGSREGTTVSKANARPSPGWIEPETSTSMAARADRFLVTYLLPTILRAGEDDTITIVSHGIFLGVLWTQLAAVLGDRVRWREAPAAGLVWSNTGYMWIRLVPPPPLPALRERAHSPGDAMNGWSAVVEKINSNKHLKGLKRTRGGVGSAQYQPSQRTVRDYFKSLPEPASSKKTRI